LLVYGKNISDDDDDDDDDVMIDTWATLPSLLRLFLLFFPLNAVTLRTVEYITGQAI